MALTQISTQGIKDGTITGTDLATNVDLVDNQKLRLGTSNDLQIYHDDTTSRVHSVSKPLLIKTIDGYDLTLQTNSENAVVCKGNAAVELYYNNSKKFETTSAGVKVGDDLKVEFGDGDDLEIYHASSSDVNIINSLKPLRLLSNGNTTIESTTAEVMVKAIPDGAVELYHNNSKKFETTSGGVLTTGNTSTTGAFISTQTGGGVLSDNLSLVDNKKVKLGTSDDLQIYHDGTSSRIENATGALTIKSDTNIGLYTYTGTELLAKFIQNGSAELYYDNSKKFETQNLGVTVTGGVYPAAADTYQLGGGSLRWNELNIKSVIDVSDNGKIRIGDGDDLQLLHDGSRSSINNRTGELRVLANNNIRLGYAAASNTTSATENYAIFNYNGSVELYYDNSKKFETHSGGVNVTGSVNPTGNVALLDNSKLKLGTGDDLKIYHSTANNIIQCDNGMQLHINKSDTENMAKFIPDGAVELYFNNSLRLSTTANGVTLGHNLFLDNATNAGRDVTWDPANDQLQWKDNTKASFGNNSDLQIYHQGSHSYIQDVGTGSLILVGNNVTMQNAAQSENMFSATENGAVELYFDGSKKFETQNLGVTVTGGVYPAAADTYQLGGSSLRWNELNIKSVIDVSDNGKIRMGDSDDLEIFHDGSDSFIKDIGTGALKICSNLFRVNNAANNEAMIKAEEDAGVTLSFNGSTKFETDSGGVVISGRVHANGSNNIGYSVADSVKSTFGDSDDLQIQHNGNSIIGHNGAGHFFVETTGSGEDLYLQANNNVRIRTASNENAIICNKDGSVDLYYDNVKQMETTSGGASIRNHHKFDTGTVTQRSYLSSGNGINHRIMLAGAGTSNVQGQYIRAFANCANINDSGTVKFVIFATGDCQNANNSFAGFSDVNLKQDITDAGSQWDDIKNLRVRKYRFKNNPTGPLQIGCIAQEVETVSAGLIDTDPEEGFKSLKYSVLYMKGIKCLQEAMARIEALETEVAALKAA